MHAFCLHDTTQKMKLKCRKPPIWPHLLKKSSMEKFIFCAVRDSVFYLCVAFSGFFFCWTFFFLPEALQTKKNLERGKEQESSNNCGSHSKFIVADINKFINSLYNY